GGGGGGGGRVGGGEEGGAGPAGAPSGGAGGRRRRGGRAPLAGDPPVGEGAAARPAVPLQPVLAPADAGPDRVAEREPAGEEPVAAAQGRPRPQRPEEARLLDVGAAVLGAEDVAVAALVAEVLEVRDLVGLARDEGARGR